MDTNRNDGQNYQINTFNKGMNTDTALDAVAEGQYIFGQNIRIANNTLLVGNVDPNSKEGLVTPVEEGLTIPFTTGTSLSDKIIGILATASIGNIGAIVVKTSDQDQQDHKNIWWVYKVERLESPQQRLQLSFIYKSTTGTDRDKFSVVINKEQEDIVKLYIADGEHGIMQLFLKNGDQSVLWNAAYQDDYLVSGKYFPKDKITIVGTTPGKLKTQQVQYTYRFFKRFGAFSKIAPLTNKIQIINNSRATEAGNAENTRSSIGMKVRIPISSVVRLLFDHIQLIRVSYVVAGQVPEIDIVDDVRFDEYAGDSIDLIDDGETSLKELSVDEFFTLNGQSIIPQTIEQNQNYMFAANIKDETTFEVSTEDAEFYQLFDETRQSPIENAGTEAETEVLGNEIPGKKIKWRFVCADIQACDKTMTAISGQNADKLYFLSNTQNGITTYSNVNPVTPIETVVNSDLGVLGVGETRDLSGGYENIFRSSLFRSLARGETYTYGIVFYDTNGSKSDVICIDDITVPTEQEFPSWRYDVSNDVLHVYPIGIRFSITEFPTNVVGYEIVRKQKFPNEFRTILQCALSRPVRQTLYSPVTDSNIPRDTSKQSPYYPTFLISNGYVDITHSENSNNSSGDILLGVPCRTPIDQTLFQIFAPEILYKRKQLLEDVSNTQLELGFLYDVYDQFGDLSNIEKTQFYSNSSYERASGTGKAIELGPGYWFKIYPHLSGFKKEDKPGNSYVVRLFERLQLLSQDTTLLKRTVALDVSVFTIPVNAQSNNPYNNVKIKHINDIKNAQWCDGFTNIVNNGEHSEITSGTKAYKSYITTLGSSQYVNWVCSGMYDYPICNSEAEGKFSTQDVTTAIYDIDWEGMHWDADSNIYRMFTDTILDYYDKRGHYKEKTDISRGWIGPGPVCFLIDVDNVGSDSILNLQQFRTHEQNEEVYPGTVITSLINTAVSVPDYTHRELFIYNGYGNYHTTNSQVCYVFDGDRYITPCEFVSMFKAYDFNSLDDTLDSSQVVYYIPLESRINTFFDYGMNYRNTRSTNLMLEPGVITGIAIQERPLHQYNPIYSDNETSISVYTAMQKESRTNNFPNRIYYSEPKTNGEQMESWNIFKASNYIDTDTRYGEVTNLLSANDIIYFWQKQAFGKLSVNERSLVTDNNNNTIQLGQGGVLQRTDYLSTKYGMRPQDYSAINTETGLFWIDILNRAIVANSKEGVVNYGEVLNVQNLINRGMTEDHPEIDYDLQNSELLCKCLDGDQLVFNLKYNIATAVYNRSYDKMLYFNNVLYALNTSSEAKQLNYLQVGEYPLLHPTVLQFVVNNSPSQTKVFDNQKIVVANKDHATAYTQQLEFKTELNTSSVGLGWLLDTPLPLRIRVTDREQNICYAIPRDNDTDGKLIGNNNMRMRGKWMTVKITDNDPKQDFAISHIITKFRQSYS